MKLKIFKNKKLVEVLEGADLVAILSDTFNDAVENEPFSYAYFSACQEDESLSSSDGDEFVAGLFKIFNKVIDNGGYQFDFEPYLVVTTKKEMTLYLKQLHDWYDPIFIDVRNSEKNIGQRFLIDSVNKKEFSGIKLFDKISNEVFEIAKDLLENSPLGPSVKEDAGNLGYYFSDEEAINKAVNDATDLLIRNLAAIYYTRYIDSDKKEELDAFFNSNTQEG